MNNWYGQYPSHWKLERLQNYLVEINESNNPVKSDNILSLTNKLGVVPYSEKGNQGNVAKENLEGYKLAYPDTIVCNCMNVLIGSVGISKYYGCVSPVYYVYKAKDNADLEFINYVFQTVPFQKELRRYANGILEIRLRVSSSNILKRKIPIPTKEEQVRIVKAIKSKEEKINALITNEEKQIEKLKAYKQALISEVVTKGLDSNISMKDSGVEWIGYIPKHWKKSKIKHLIDWIGSGTTPSNDQMLYYKDDINWIQSGDLYQKKFIRDTTKKVSKIAVDALSTLKIYNPNFIVIAMYGASVGNVAISTIEACSNQACCCLKTNSKNDLMFLYYWLIFCKDDFLKSTKGGTQPNISQDRIKNQFVILPLLDEQIDIANFLDTKCGLIDSTIDCHNSKIEKLKQYRQSMIYEYVTGKRKVY